MVVLWELNNEENTVLSLASGTHLLFNKYVVVITFIVIVSHNSQCIALIGFCKHLVLSVFSEIPQKGFILSSEEM